MARYTDTELVDKGAQGGVNVQSPKHHPARDVKIPGLKKRWWFPLTNYHFRVENPDDLYPVAQLLTRRIDEEVDQLEPGQNLFINMGENHPRPTTKLPQVIVADHLQQNYKDDFVVGIEGCHQTLDDYYETPEATAHDLMSSMMKNSCYTLAPQTMNRLFAMLLRENIPTVFNDARWDMGGEYVHPDDPVSQAVAAKLFNDMVIKKHETSTEDPTGVAIRNGAMVAKALKAAKQTQARIIMQQCGRSHVYGNEGKGDQYKHSLTALQKAEGARVLNLSLIHI